MTVSINLNQQLLRVGIWRDSLAGWQWVDSRDWIVPPGLVVGSGRELSRNVRLTILQFQSKNDNNGETEEQHNADSETAIEIDEGEVEG